MRERRISTVQLLVVALISVSSALVVVVTSKMARAGDRPQGEAELWLSWSSEARTTYVWGYLHGFDAGKHEACSFYGEKMKAYMHEPVTPDKLPRAVCLDALPRYPESNFQVYVDAITNYFTMYPRDREAGMERIMMELASPPGLTIDQIHAKLTGH
jgi:hypothetical protein